MIYMGAQIGYMIATPLTEETVRKIWHYVQGPLCDLYGTETPIYLGGQEYGYIIQRVNALPFLPKLDKLLEITFPDNSTLINCYFAREHWVEKMKNTLEKITGEEVSMQKAEWKLVDIESVLREVGQK